MFELLQFLFLVTDDNNASIALSSHHGYYLRQRRGYAISAVVCHSICLSFCLPLSAGLLQKYSANFIETWCYDWVYKLEELINFCW